MYDIENNNIRTKISSALDNIVISLTTFIANDPIQYRETFENIWGIYSSVFDQFDNAKPGLIDFVILSCFDN